MTSPKIKKTLVLRSLTVIVSIVFFIVILECIATVLLSMGYSFAERPNPYMDSEIPETQYTMEISSPKPEQLYSQFEIPHSEPRGLSLHPHVNKEELTLSIPINNFDGYVEKRIFVNQPPIYSIHLKLDEYGRRDTNGTSNQTYKNHLALFGCSYAFGEAVGPESTLSAHWQQTNPSYKTYNVNFSGYGPNDILARSLSFGFMENISPKNGIGIYLYTDNQIKRSQGAMSVVASWAPRSAVLEETGPYAFKHLGSHYTARKIRTVFLQLLWSSHIVQLFKIDWPASITTDDYDRMAREIKGIELLYKAKTSPENPFIVALYPSTMYQTNPSSLKHALEKHKVLFIDYTKYPMEMRLNEASIVPNDGHPNPAAYKHLADLLIRDLQKFLK